MEARFTYRCSSIWKMQLGRNANMLANEMVFHMPGAYESFLLSNTFSVLSKVRIRKVDHK